MATATQELSRIVATVIDLHPKSGDNWSRAKVQFEDGRTAWVVAKFRLQEGETIEADCTYNDKYRSYDIVKLAGDANGKVSNAVVILKLVDILDGVGQVKARKLGEKFPDLYETLLEAPEKIAEACGANVQDVITVKHVLEGERATLSMITNLVQKGFPHHLAKRIADVDQHYRVALESPYAAIKLVSGLGWLIADEVGRKQGIAADNIKRIEAGIDYFYNENVAGEGHTIVHRDTLLATENLPQLLGVSVRKIEPVLDTVLCPTSDGWYTSERHRRNADLIAEFFLPSAEQGE